MSEDLPTVEQRQETRAIPQADSLSREELVRAGARDPEALGRFFDFYVDRVFALAYRLLGDRATAEDVSQEVFLESSFAYHGTTPILELPDPADSMSSKLLIYQYVTTIPRMKANRCRAS